MDIDGRLIKKKRKQKGYSQYRLAKKLGVDPDEVKDWERNRKQPDKHILRRLAKILGARPVELRRAFKHGRVW